MNIDLDRQLKEGLPNKRDKGSCGVHRDKWIRHSPSHSHGQEKCFKDVDNSFTVAFLTQKTVLFGSLPKLDTFGKEASITG